jgi:type I restriction enzyme, S subunit
VDHARAAAEAQLEAAKALPAAYLCRALPKPGMDAPRGWRWTKLQELCHLITDGTHRTPQYTEAGIRFISIANLRRFMPIDWAAYVRYISPEEHAELVKRCRPERDDILFAQIGTLGLAKRIDFDEEVSIFVGLALLKLKQDLVDPVYLEAYLNSPHAEAQAIAGAQGGGRQTLPLQNPELFDIPVPPLPEQRRIAAILAERTAMANRACTALEAQLSLIDQLPAALLRQAFNGEL